MMKWPICSTFISLLRRTMSVSLFRIYYKRFWLNFAKTNVSMTTRCVHVFFIHRVLHTNWILHAMHRTDAEKQSTQKVTTCHVTLQIYDHSLCIHTVYGHHTFGANVMFKRYYVCEYVCMYVYATHRIPRPSRTDTPPHSVVWIAPHKIANRPFVRNFLYKFTKPYNSKRRVIKRGVPKLWLMDSFRGGRVSAWRIVK